MIVGYGFWGAPENALFSTQMPAQVSEDVRLELYDATYDEINIRNYTNLEAETALEDLATDKQPWQPNNMMLAKFNGNLEAGSIDLNGMIIEKLALKRRKAGTVTWETIKIIDYDSSQVIYSLIDKIVESQEAYEYAIVPMAGTLEGSHVPHEIFVEYDDCFLLDQSSTFRLYYALNLGEIQTIIPNSTLEPLGGTRFPIVIYSGDLRYKAGNISCSLIAGKELNYAADKVLRNNVMDFLCNKKPKILKHGSGEFLLITIVGTPIIQPDNGAPGLYDVEFEFVECGDIYDLAYLEASGLVKVDESSAT